MAPFPDQLTAACSDISSLGRGKWGEIGLNLNEIQEPICTTVDNNPGTNPKTEIANIIQFWTQLFTTQLVGSFDIESRQYLCKNLDFFLIDYFMLTSSDVVGGVCNRSVKLGESSHLSFLALLIGLEHARRLQ